MKKEKQPIIKRRRTLDDLLGINGLLTVAFLVSPFVEPFKSIAYVCGLTAIYKMFKHRKDIDVKKKTRIIRWVLLILWILEVITIENIS